jgi:predicted HicB family RNase H-like nuclease
MNDILEYKTYYAIIQFSAEDEVFYGKIIGINDLVSFEGTTVSKLKAAFHEAVDDYLDFCKKLGKEPEKTYKGSFNVRIPSELHRRAARYANSRNISLNDLVRTAIDYILTKPPDKKTTDIISLCLTFVIPALLAGFLFLHVEILISKV